MKKVFALGLVALLFASCAENASEDSKPNVVATTTMIADLAKQIGGDSINVQGLMSIV